MKYKFESEEYDIEVEIKTKKFKIMAWLKDSAVMVYNWTIEEFPNIQEIINNNDVNWINKICIEIEKKINREINRKWKQNKKDKKIKELKQKINKKQKMLDNYNKYLENSEYIYINANWNNRYTLERKDLYRRSMQRKILNEMGNETSWYKNLNIKNDTDTIIIWLKEKIKKIEEEIEEIEEKIYEIEEE